jgi:hypothetical protein
MEFVEDPVQHKETTAELVVDYFSSALTRICGNLLAMIFDVLLGLIVEHWQ